MIIKKGKHYTSIFYKFPWIHLFKRTFNKKFVFTDSCKYKFIEHPEDQFDANKLFGYHSGNIHKNSARFGWRYDDRTKMIELSSYVYINGERKIKALQQIPLNKEVEATLVFEKTKVRWLINGVVMNTIDLSLRSPLFVSGLYFGGNRTCDHDIIIN